MSGLNKMAKENGRELLKVAQPPLSDRIRGWASIVDVLLASTNVTSSIAMLYGATISIFTLFVARDVSFASVSRQAVVQAYAWPPHTSFRSPRNKCNCKSGRQPSYRPVACKLRCGGGTVGDDISQRRHSTSSLSMTQPDSSGGEVVVVVKNNAKYHLIWSAGFWKKMTISTILLLILQSALKRSTYALELIALPLHACHGRILPSVILPLLSSSCCAIQLIINALSGWGCAGFNAYLGKLNFVAIVISLLWV